jgi:hypothetical protein
MEWEDGRPVQHALGLDLKQTDVVPLDGLQSGT